MGTITQTRTDLTQADLQELGEEFEIARDLGMSPAQAAEVFVALLAPDPRAPAARGRDAALHGAGGAGPGQRAEPMTAAVPRDIARRLREQVYEELLSELEASGGLKDSRQIQWIVDEFPVRLAKRFGRACITSGALLASRLS